METKTCKKCGLTKSLEEFHKDNTQRGTAGQGRKYKCKQCSNSIWKDKYASNDTYRLEHQLQARERVKAQRKDFQIRILKQLVATGCVDCGEKDPIVLEFDHVVGDKVGDKVAGVSAMIRKTNNWNKIQAEIDKCVPRCANCHRRKTSKTHNWYSDIDLTSL